MASNSVISQASLYKRDLGWKHLDQTKFTYITFSSSLSLRILTYPLSLIKCNQQTRNLNTSNLRSGPQPTISRRIFINQGIRGFYKGLTINLIGNGSHVIYATVYETMREFLQNKININSPFVASACSGISGIFASGIQLSLSTPFDIVSQKRMILEGNDMNNIKAIDIFKQILSEERSVFGLWRGLSISLMTYAPTSGIVWASYRYNKPKMHHLFGNKDNSNILFLNFIAGALSGAMAGFLTVPLDTIKVRKQVLGTRSTKVVNIVKNVYHERGLTGFYRGVVPRTCQYTITCAIIMVLYDWVKLMSTNTKHL